VHVAIGHGHGQLDRGRVGVPDRVGHELGDQQANALQKQRIQIRAQAGQLAAGPAGGTGIAGQLHAQALGVVATGFRVGQDARHGSQCPFAQSARKSTVASGCTAARAGPLRGTRQWLL